MEKYAYSSKYVWKVETFQSWAKDVRNHKCSMLEITNGIKDSFFFYLNQIIDVNTFLNLEARFSVNVQLNSISFFSGR